MKKRIAYFAVLCAVALLLGGCTEEKTDARLRDFYERLRARDEAEDADCVWSIDADATVGGTTLSVREAIGNDRQICLLVEVTPPVEAQSVMPDEFRCKNGHIAESAATGRDFAWIDNMVSDLPVRGSVVLESVDGEPGLFLASFSCEVALEGREVTLVFGDLRVLNAKNEETASIPGPFLIRWTAEKV